MQLKYFIFNWCATMLHILQQKYPLEFLCEIHVCLTYELSKNLKSYSLYQLVWCKYIGNVPYFILCQPEIFLHFREEFRYRDYGQGGLRTTWQVWPNDWSLHIFLFSLTPSLTPRVFILLSVELIVFGSQSFSSFLLYWWWNCWWHW